MAQKRRQFAVIGSHTSETVKGRFKWRYRFNTYVLRVPYMVGQWLNHTVVIKQKVAYFNVNDHGDWQKGIYHMSNEEYSELMRAILLGGLSDGQEDQAAGKRHTNTY